MFLLLSSSIILILCIAILYFPYLGYYGIDLGPSFILILITIIGLKSGKRSATLLGFFIGLIQDLMIQYLSLGFFSLLGTCFGYSIGNIRIIRDIRMKYILIFIVFFIYSYLYFMITYSESYFFYFKFSLIKTGLTIFVFFLLRNFFINFFKTIEK